MKEYHNHLPIKMLAEEDRPREKMMRQGRQTLTDAELLAILMGSGNRDESAVQLAQRILAFSNHNLNELAKLGLKDFQKFNGVGPAKAISIMSALELGRRRKSEESLKRIQITSSKNAYECLVPKLQDLQHEEFWVLLLSRSNKVLSTKLISKGGVSGTVADVKIIMKYALETLSSGMILAHNHPSGSLSPSQADLNLTKKIMEACKVMDVALLDHLIITDESYMSFADEGLL